MTSFMLSFVYGSILNRIMGFSLLIFIKTSNMYLNFYALRAFKTSFSFLLIMNLYQYNSILSRDRMERNSVQISIIFNIYPIMVKTREMIQNNIGCDVRKESCNNSFFNAAIIIIPLPTQYIPHAVLNNHFLSMIQKRTCQSNYIEDIIYLGHDFYFNVFVFHAKSIFR